jgi:hypothetical protein
MTWGTPSTWTIGSDPAELVSSGLDNSATRGCTKIRSIDKWLRSQWAWVLNISSLIEDGSSTMCHQYGRLSTTLASRAVHFPQGVMNMDEFL